MSTTWKHAGQKLHIAHSCVQMTSEAHLIAGVRQLLDEMLKARPVVSAHVTGLHELRPDDGLPWCYCEACTHDDLL